jgi:hypothetical protein
MRTVSMSSREARIGPSESQGGRVVPDDPLHGIRQVGGIPSLEVGDLTTATDYYRRVLGFETLAVYDETVAFVRGHGVTLQLCCAPGAELPGSPACGRGTPDAVLMVNQPGQVWRSLNDRCADLLGPDCLPPEWAEFFGVTDCFGNLLGIGPVKTRRAAVRRQAGRLTGDAALRLHERRRAREEARHIEELRTFYRGLADKKDIYYMFFSEGLLHWAVKALSYVPENVNIVLLGTGLPEAEAEWIARNVSRPFHNIRLRIDDQIAWEFLFEVNQQSFGWLDTDCLVLNGDLFGELAALDPATSLNCAWSWDSGFGFPLGNTFFMFINERAVALLRKQGPWASPSSYHYWWENLHVPGRRCYSRRPTGAQIKRLRGILPAGDSGRPATPSGMPYFDTTVMYQILARSYGLGIGRVRELEGFGHLRGRPVQDESSNELLHIGGVSKADALDELSGFFNSTGVRLLYLVAEYIMLDGVADQLPPYYADRLAQVVAALARNGLTPEAAEDLVRQHLMETRQMSEDAAGAVLRRPELVPGGQR